MASKVRIPTPLRKLTDNQESIEVESNTIGGAIDELEGKFPGIKERLVDEEGKYLELMHYAEGSAMLPMLLLLYSSSLGKKAEPLMDRIFSEINLHVGYLTDCLGENDFFFRNKFSGLDTMISFVLEAAKISDSLKSFPNLINILNKYQSRPAYKKALEKGGEYILGS